MGERNITIMENGNQRANLRCFREWMNLQEQDLLELLQALNIHKNEHDHATSVSELLQKNIQHFQEYAVQRATLAQEDIFPYFSPTWCSPLENSMLWAGGCRPTLFVRLVYALCGNAIVSHLSEYLHGGTTGSCIGELSASQMGLINCLQMRTIHEEDKISKKLASLQEEIADDPIAIMAKEARAVHGETSREVTEALNAHAVSMMKVLKEADGLRLSAMKELIGILTPIQGVEYLASGKKLHLCLHEWGISRDRAHGRNACLLENNSV